MGQVFRRDAVLFAVALGVGLGAGLGAGCSTVSAPVLRNETGETLGQKRFRVFGHYESSRIFTPGEATDPIASGVNQNNSAFQGSLLGIQADGGVLPQLDAQVGAFFTSDGGGWRVGAKYQLHRGGRLAVAAMAGYSVMSGSGTVTYLTTGIPENIPQTLSSSTIDLSVPVSFRFGPVIALYGGPMWLHSAISGSYDGLVGADTYNDFGANLGLQFTSGIFTGDLEAAELLVQDPFVGSSRMVPYVGISFGVLF